MILRAPEAPAREWIERLADAARTHSDSEDILAIVVNQARGAGLSWAQVAEGLGVARQTAHRHWAHRVEG
jgi:hypothetical protein